MDAGIGTVVCGHTHMPYTRLAHGRLVVNPGSVGMPYGRPGAHWALLGPGWRGSCAAPRSTTPRPATGSPRESGFRGGGRGRTTYVHARNSAEDAVAAFGPRDGRARLAVRPRGRCGMREG